MKKKLIKRNILVWAGALLAIVAFFVAFSAGLRSSATVGGLTVTTELKGLIIGTIRSFVDGKEMPIVGSSVHATLSLVGIIVGLVAAVLAVLASIFGKGKARTIVVVVCGILLVAACVLVFLEKQTYISALAAKEGVSKDIIKPAMEGQHLNAGCVISAILFGLGGVTVTASEFVK